jgi:nicotinamide-nucleotide amidase
MNEVVAVLSSLGQTVAAAESLTGGLVLSQLIDPPGASAVVRGGVVAYATDAKASVLGVDAELLDERGAVDGDVAQQMAEGVRRVLHADWGVATTGVAGPEPQDGMPVGRVYVAVAGPDGTRVQQHDLSGDRREIRDGAVGAALALLMKSLDATT